MIKIFLSQYSCIKINAIFTKSTVNIINILLSNTGEYSDNRPIHRRDMDSTNISRLINTTGMSANVRHLSEPAVSYPVGITNTSNHNFPVIHTHACMLRDIILVR